MSRLTSADTCYALANQAVAARPRLVELIGRNVVLGVRPEDFEVAQARELSSAVCRMKVRVDITETLGRESYLYFDVHAGLPLIDGVDELISEQLSSDARASTTTFVARVSARRAASIGDEVELAVDSSDLHFFDVDSGAAIGENG